MLLVGNIDIFLVINKLRTLQKQDKSSRKHLVSVINVRHDFGVSHNGSIEKYFKFQVLKQSI